MDIGTVIGMALGIGAIVWSILLGSSLTVFFDAPSIVVVTGGVVAAMFIKWPMEYVKQVPSYYGKTFFNKSISVLETIEEIGKLAETARRESVFALEKVEVPDAFMKKAMALAADNRPPEIINSILQMEIDAMESRHKTGIGILDAISLDGPAFGMIGTLIGLVQMLQNLSDPSAIGPAMAVALLTTFYGSVIANLFSGPFKNKLAQRSEIEILRMKVIILGTLGIVAGENPRLIKEKLVAFLPPKDRPKEEAAA